MLSEQQHGAGTLYLIIYVLYALHESLALDYHQRNELRGVDAPGGELAQVLAVIDQ